MSILRIGDASGRFVEIPSIKGDKGDAGSVTANMLDVYFAAGRLTAEEYADLVTLVA